MNKEQNLWSPNPELVGGSGVLNLPNESISINSINADTSWSTGAAKDRSGDGTRARSYHDFAGI